MAFKNLEERYNATINQLYADAKTKFDNGKPSKGRNDDPLIVRKPGAGYWGFGEGRGTPIRSATEDLKRLSLFITSVRGLSFLAKQQLLQTGNTFESTRIINPTFVLANAIPFTHAKRAIDIPITARGIGRALLGGGAIAQRLFGSGAQKTDVISLRKIGQLQQETYNKAVQTISVKNLIKKIPVIGQTITALKAKRSMGEVDDGWTNSRPELSKLNIVGAVTTLFSSNVSRSGYVMANQVVLNKKTKNKYTTSFEPKYVPRLSGTYTTYLGLFRGRTDYTKYNSFNNKQGGQTAKEYKAVTETLSELGTENKLEFKTYKKSIQETQLDTQLKNTTYLSDNNPRDYTSPSSLLNEPTSEKPRSDRLSEAARTIKYLENTNGLVNNQGLDLRPQGPLQFLKYFRGDVESITTRTQNTNAKYIAENRTDKSKKISYIKDPANTPRKSEQASVQTAYKPINHKFSDPVTVSFAMGKDDHIQFRAFIKDLNQTSNPQYQSFQYVGRIEKFINYTGVQREISFKLALIAFSKDELDTVWRRINYLTGLTFPYGFTKGLLQPNVVRLTLGGVYTDQPGYITSLNTNFSEPTDSWDIDKGVPIGAMMDIRFVLIEKATRVADSPFYGITDGSGRTYDNKQPMDRFSRFIDVASSSGLDGFDDEDKQLTAQIVEANSRLSTAMTADERGEINTTITNLGTLQAERRTARREFLRNNRQP